jgi:sensor domain CHASE-containing protein
VNEQDQERIKQLLKETMQPITGQVGSELRRDLWPAMLKRLEARPAKVPWFDWALLAAVAALLVFFPGAIPVFLYHL